MFLKTLDDTIFPKVSELDLLLEPFDRLKFNEIVNEFVKECEESYSKTDRLGRDNIKRAIAKKLICPFSRTEFEEYLTTTFNSITDIAERFSVLDKIGQIFEENEFIISEED